MGTLDYLGPPGHIYIIYKLAYWSLEAKGGQTDLQKLKDDRQTYRVVLLAAFFIQKGLISLQPYYFLWAIKFSEREMRATKENREKMKIYTKYTNNDKIKIMKL